MSMVCLVLAWLALACLPGCAGPLPVPPEAVVDTQAAAVSSCLRVGVVRGESDLGDLVHGQGLAQARDRARRNAARLGADHVVWRPVPPVHAPYVAADAYRCDNDKAPAP